MKLAAVSIIIPIVLFCLNFSEKIPLVRRLLVRLHLRAPKPTDIPRSERDVEECRNLDEGVGGVDDGLIMLPPLSLPPPISLPPSPTSLLLALPPPPSSVCFSSAFSLR